MIERKIDIVMMALPRWDGVYSSTAFSLAKEFSKTNRVFYIDNPFTWKEFFTKFKSSQVSNRKEALLSGKNFTTDVNPNLTIVTPKLTIPINFFPKGKMYERLSAINDKIVFKSLEKLFDEYNIKDFIFINSFNPFYGRSWPSFFRPKLYIYHTVDDISHSWYVRKHGPRLENEAIKKADVTFTTSLELKRLKSDLTPHIYYLPNAADTSLFKQSVTKKFLVPDDLKDNTKPIVMYTGHIDSRLDFDLLKFIYNAHPDKLFVMVGPTSLEKDVSEALTAFANVLFVGRKDISLLPQYLQYAQCTIIPFKCNTLTKSIYPLKINEYLAAGKPVVSTPFSDDIKTFAETAEIQSDYDKFSYAINTSIILDSPEKKKKRIEVAEENTWEARVEMFWSILEPYLNRN